MLFDRIRDLISTSQNDGLKLFDNIDFTPHLLSKLEDRPLMGSLQHVLADKPVLGALRHMFDFPAFAKPKITAPPEDLSITEFPGLYDFQKYMQTDKYNIQILGTASVSDKMMIQTRDLIQNIVGALKKPEDQAKFSGCQIYVVTFKDPDISQWGGNPTQRDSGGKGWGLMCENMVNQVQFGEHRAWDTPVHEFGHTIDDTLELNSKEVFRKMYGNSFDSNVEYEYFAWKTQQWFSQLGTKQDRNDMKFFSPKEYNYMATIFDVNNKWLPRTTS